MEKSALSLKYVNLAVGIVSAFAFYFLLTTIGMPHMPAITAAITLLTVICWVTESLPIPVTSLMPFVPPPLFWCNRS